MDFFDTSSLAVTIAHVVELRTTYTPLANNLDGSHTWGMDREDTFTGNAVSSTTNREGFRQALANTFDDNAFVCLQTFSVPFDDLYFDANSVARTKFRNVGLHLCFFDLFDDIHVLSPFILQTFITASAANGQRTILIHNKKPLHLAMATTQMGLEPTTSSVTAGALTN
mgnify:CR=1 FL=1